MRIIQRNSLITPSPGFTKIVEDAVLNSLNMTTNGVEFVGNDTCWYQKTPTYKLTPTALNSAHFLSKTFLSNLKARNWEIEKNIDGQTFDAYFESAQNIDVFDVSVADYPAVIATAWTTPRENDEYALVISKAWQELVQRGFSISDAKIPNNLYTNFLSSKKQRTLRVGLEFETGNIASCFRSITKLGVLYKARKIDFGILISFNDKANSACRLFPSSNRNGSFEELDKRHFENVVDFPLWQIGFEPERFDPNAPYLGAGPSMLFHPTPDGVETINGETLTRFKSHDGRTIFRRQ